MFQNHLKTLLATPLPNIYRRAAEIVQLQEEWYSCDAIHDAVQEEFAYLQSDSDVLTITEKYVEQYSLCFGPSSVHDYFAYETGHHPYWNASPYSENPGEITQHRVTALLLMANIIEGIE